MKAALTSTVHRQKNPFSNCRTHNDVRRSAWSLTRNKVQSYGLVSCRLFQIESTQSLGIVTISRQRSYPSLLKWEPVLRALLRNILYKSRIQIQRPFKQYLIISELSGRQVLRSW